MAIGKVGMPLQAIVFVVLSNISSGTQELPFRLLTGFKIVVTGTIGSITASTC